MKKFGQLPLPGGRTLAQAAAEFRVEKESRSGWGLRMMQAGKPAIPFLVDLMGSCPDEDGRGEAASALALMIPGGEAGGGERVEPCPDARAALLGALEDEDATIRLHALVALDASRIAEGAFVPRLRYLRQADPDPRVREGARLCLLRRGE